MDAHGRMLGSAAALGRVAAAGLLLLAGAVALVGCGGSSESGAPSLQTTTSSSLFPESTIAHLPAGPTVPAFTPVGFQPLSGADLDVAVAIPGSWQATPVNGRVVESGGINLEQVDPQLGGLLRQLGGYLGNAVSVAGIDRNLATQGRGALLSQSRVVVASVPQAMVSQVQTSLDAIGAVNVRITRVAVPGLPADAQAVRFDSVLAARGVSTPLAVVLVPATRGIALVAVRAPVAVTRGVLATLAAR